MQRRPIEKMRTSKASNLRIKNHKINLLINWKRAILIKLQFNRFQKLEMPKVSFLTLSINKITQVAIKEIWYIEAHLELKQLLLSHLQMKRVSKSKYQQTNLSAPRLFTPRKCNFSLKRMKVQAVSLFWSKLLQLDLTPPKIKEITHL